MITGGGQATKWAWVAVACFSAAAAGQVQQVENGQALDANPGVGRMGYNTPALQRNPISSQLYITGQVSGLAQFRDRVGYVGPGQLGLVLPSAEMDTFGRQSIGAMDATRNRPYLTQPYYDPATTTMYLSRAIPYQQSGMSLPAVSPSVPTAISQQLYVDALSRYGTILNTQEGMAAPSPRGDVTLGGRLAASGQGLAVQASPYEAGGAAGISGLFGIPRGNEQVDLQRELYAQAHRDEMVGSQVRAQVGGKGAGTDGVGRADSLASLTGAAEGGADQTRGGLPGTVIGQGPVNQDVFLDMLVKMRQVREQQAAGPTTAPGVAPAAIPGAAQAAAMPGRKSLVDIGPGNALVIHGLAGQSKDMFNMNMVRAAEEMRTRRYYDAAQTYETAGLVDPRNPLAHVGMGLSLLGAGETLSAAYQLSQAVTLFPPMMETRFDLPGMVDPKVVDAQLNRLDDRIAQADPESKRMLQFLAVFLYRNSNREDKAKTYAEQLLTNSKNNAILRAYADLVLTGKSPATKGEGGPPSLIRDLSKPILLPGVPATSRPTTKPAATPPPAARPAGGVAPRIK